MTISKNKSELAQEEEELKVMGKKEEVMRKN